MKKFKIKSIKCTKRNINRLPPENGFIKLFQGLFYFAEKEKEGKRGTDEREGCRQNFKNSIKNKF